jgi:hypothetical protein
LSALRARKVAQATGAMQGWTATGRRVGLVGPAGGDKKMQLGVHLSHIGRKAGPDSIRRAAV